MSFGAHNQTLNVLPSGRHDRRAPRPVIKSMHPRSPYRNPPDFLALAAAYPPLKPQ